jgi:uncharacterized protein DUF695
MDRLKSLVTDQDTWTSAEGENDGAPFLLRFRPNLQEFIETKRYNKHLTLLWNYDSDNTSLMPDKKEMELMEEVEKSLIDIFENDLHAILSFVYLGNNQKEWHWYSSDIAETGKRLNKALSNFDVLPIELSSEDDPVWSEYNAVIKGADDSEYEGTEDE